LKIILILIKEVGILGTFIIYL